MRQGLNRLPGAIVGGVRGALFGAASAVGRVVRDPVTRLGSAVDYAMSGARVIGPAAEPSPLLRRRSLSSRSEAIDIEFGDLHRAAKAAGGSINDAYLAGLCGALRLYHEALGAAGQHAADGGAGEPARRRRTRPAATGSPGSTSPRRSAPPIPRSGSRTSARR